MFSIGYGQEKPERVSILSGSQQRISDDLAQRIASGMQQGPVAAPFQTWLPKTLKEGQLESEWMSGENLAMRRKALMDILGGQPAFTYNEGQIDQAFQGIGNEMYRGLNKQIVPNIGAASVAPGGAGRYSSGYVNQVKDASEAMVSKVGAMRSAFTMEKQGAAEAELSNAKLRQAQYGPMAVAGEYGLQSGIAAQDRAIQEQKIMAQMAEWMRGAPVNGVRDPSLNPWLILAQNYLNMPQYAVGQSGFNIGVGGGSPGGTSGG